ncbi:AraC family transcriptional regulator [Azospirillum sp. SYSU D00513]|uniref:helix-turn-helix domain-containing protein n=1 Tax=Azospirillum sp. SYSU D00513 TaxID=2812561 RepID=UPI001A9704FF|nr:AraC family transcriptional regulator [Azospirillum sp. SYSU D00513]
MTTLDGYTIHDVLRGAGAALRAAAPFGDGVAAALWDRESTSETRYTDPGHHTLSLYLDGGTGISRLRGRNQPLKGGGPGSLCIMPADVSSDWDVSGPVRLFHLYIPKPAFDRAVVEALDADPAAVRLRDETYVQDTAIETVIRSAILPLRWDEPADRVATSHAGRMLIAYLASRFTERAPQALFARGGLAPAVLRRVAEFVEAHLDAPLSIDDLAAVAGLSPFHFARAFKRSTGEAPHRFVLRRRIERAKSLIAMDGLPLAEVAAACGFSSQSHFTLRFREVTGLTPKRFASAG